MGTAGSKESKYYPEFEKNLPSLAGKNVAITGCTSGTGLVTAKCAARKGADAIIMLNRPSERAKAAAEVVRREAASPRTRVDPIDCDLQSFSSVDRAIKTIQSRYKKIDVLCNNAGVMALEDIATEDGYDVQIQTNYLSHYRLLNGLLPLLKRAPEARIVHHSSMARIGSPLQLSYFKKNGGNLGGNGNSMFFNGAKWERYHQSKLANMTLTSCLVDRFFDTNLKALVAAPGLAQTNLQMTTQKTNGLGSNMWIMRFAQSAEDGAMSLIHCCFGENVVNGDFYEPGVLTGPPVKKPLEELSTDPKQKDLLWKATEAACGKFNL